MPASHYYHGGESSRHGGSGDGGDRRRDKKGKEKSLFDATKEKFILHKEERMKEAKRKLVSIKEAFDRINGVRDHRDTTERDKVNFWANSPEKLQTAQSQRARIQRLYDHYRGIYSAFEADLNKLKNKDYRRYQVSITDKEVKDYEKLASEWGTKTPNLETSQSQEWDNLSHTLAQERWQWDRAQWRMQWQTSLDTRLDNLRNRHGSLTGWADHDSGVERENVSSWLAGDAYNRSGIAAQQTAEIASLQQLQHDQAQELTDAFNEGLRALHAIRYTPEAIGENQDLQAHSAFFDQHEIDVNDLETIQNEHWQELRTRHAGERGQSTQPPAYEQLNQGFW